MTVSSLTKSNSNNNTNANNDKNVSSSQAMLEQQIQQQTTSANVGRSITDEHQNVNSSRREETDGNVTSSNSMPVTTLMINDSSLTNATSSSCSVHPKPKPHYHRPHVIPTNNKHSQAHITSQEEKFRISSNTDSSDDDDNDDAEDDDDPFVSNFKASNNAPNLSKTGKSHRSNSPDQYNSEDEHEKNSRKQTKNRSDDLEMRFARVLKEKKGYIMKPVKEDGACLFRAVADQVFGDEDMHGTVRQHCMNYIQQNEDFFRAYITEDFDRYVTRKRRNSCHGNHIEIIALSELYNRPIEVYEYSLEPINVVHGMYQTDNEPIRLSYHSGIHYNSIVDPWRPTAGLGLGLPDLRPGHAQQTMIDDAVRKSEENHIDANLLNDKLTETDLDATQQEILEEITRQSYFDWLDDKNPQSNENFTVSCSNSRATTSHEYFNFDDEAVMEQMLALSTMEYIESLSKSTSNVRRKSSSSSSSSEPREQFS